MITALALAVLAVASPSDYSSWIKAEEIHIRIYDLTTVYGPMKVYCSTSGIPDAGCETCPEGVDPEYTVPSSSITQTWPQGGKMLEISFPCSSVGNEEFLYFTAVSLVPSKTVMGSIEERYCTSGQIPIATQANNAGGRNK